MGNSCQATPCAGPLPRPSSPIGAKRSSMESMKGNSAQTPPSLARANSRDMFISATNGQEARAHSSTVEAAGGEAVMAGALDISENQMSTTHFTELDTVSTVLSRGSWGSSRIPEDSIVDSITYVVLGAFSEMTFSKILPALLRLFETGLIDSKDSLFVAISREDYTLESYQAYCKERLPSSSRLDEFLQRVRYIKGSYTNPSDLRKVPSVPTGKLVYFLSFDKSIPLGKVLEAISECPSVNSWTRVILHGSDPDVYNVKDTLALGEERIFRVDPFAGSDALRRLIALRFGNRVLEPTWNRNHVKAVLFDFCLDPTASRNTSSENFLRTVFVDHILSLVALVAMERPASRFGNDVRDAKAEVLAAIQIARTDSVVFGICESKAVSDEKNPTFATVVLDIDTNRWRGVPFVVRVGMGMDRTSSEVRILFRTAAGADALWKDQGQALKDNELTIRVVPGENAMLDLVSNLPGLDSRLKNNRSTLDFLSQAAPFVPEPFERLVYDALRGRRANFVRSDGLVHAYRILESVLQPAKTVVIEKYPLASKTGPPSSDQLIAKAVNGCPWVGPSFNSDDVWAMSTNFSVAREMLLTLRLNFDQMRLLMKEFTDEMEAGLRKDESKPSTIKMLQTFVSNLPNGKEKGVYFALDFGGTNFRVVKFELEEDKPAKKIHEEKHRLPIELKTKDAVHLFDFLADCIAKVQTKDEEAIYGFTFSFPTKQETISTGRLIAWTKGWATEGVVNEEVSKLLHDALDRKGLRGEIRALINDTVGTLAAKAREEPLVKVGVILGTGTNAAFVDRTDDGGSTVINTEWGGFGSSQRLTALPFNKVDLAIDEESPNHGEQWFEKMISGFYLGEIVRRWLLLLHEKGELWSAARFAESSQLRVPFTVDSLHISNVELDLTENLSMIAALEKSVLGVDNSTYQDRVLFRDVCRAVVERAARLTACALAAVVNRINNSATVVAVDGSLFEAHASFKQRLIRSLHTLGCKCSLVLSKDGSGLGAALLAAAAASRAQ